MLSLPSLLAVSTVPLLPRACDAKTDPAKGYPAAVKKLSKALAIAGSCPESTVCLSKASRAPHYACATCRSFCLIASASLFLAICWRSEAHSWLVQSKQLLCTLPIRSRGAGRGDTAGQAPYQRRHDPRCR